MRTIYLSLLFSLVIPAGFTLKAQDTGEQIFKSVCAACHTINKGRLVGPDLSNVYRIRNNQWIIRFVRSSREFIKSGDTAAVNIFNEFTKIPMPDNHLTDAQILAVIEYIKSTDQASQATAVKPKVLPDTSVARKTVAMTDSTAIIYSVDKIPDGRSLFYGYKKFAGRAQPCISCHNTRDQSVLGGGKLAIDLTGAYKKLGAAGINSIILNPPFPVMKTAMANRIPDEKERREIIAFLKSLGERGYTYGIPDSTGIFFGGISFVLALLFLAQLYIYYNNRKIP